MEKMVAELADLVKKMREESDRETINSLKKALEENTTAMKEVVGWRSEVDSKVDNLHLSIKKLGVKVEQMSQRQEEMENPAYKVFHTEHLDFTKPAAAHLAASSPQAASGQFCHAEDEHHRGFGQGVVTPLAPTPVKGTKHVWNLHGVTRDGLNSVASNFSAALPHMPFPTFDGTSPKMWKKKCETYFDIYEVSCNLWVKIAMMNFQGSAEFWLQSLDHPYTEFS
ncbi:unnamed protein product [Urochloa humidicola]